MYLFTWSLSILYEVMITVLLEQSGFKGQSRLKCKIRQAKLFKKESNNFQNLEITTTGEKIRQTNKGERAQKLQILDLETGVLCISFSIFHKEKNR